MISCKALRGLDPWRTVEDLSPGSAALRRQIGLRYLGMGCGVDTEELVITNGAMEALKSGVFNPPGRAGPLDYAALQNLVTEAKGKLEALKPDDVNALEGKDVAFQFGETKIPFTAETFVLSFSLPNFHFHATTAYDILRSRGVPVGKRDYMGRMRIKR